MLRRMAIAAALLCGAGLSTLSAAQDAAPASAPAPADPMMQRIGEEFDRTTAGAANVSEETRPSPTVPPSAARSLAALLVVVALILLVYYAARRWGKRVPILAGSHLGKVLGRLYLDRGTALHFVQVGEKVLLIGANTNSISLIGEFPATGLRGSGAPVASGATATPFNPDSFLAELRARSQDLSTAPQRPPQAEEDEIASLRGDIHRLQRYLREENREIQD